MRFPDGVPAALFESGALFRYRRPASVVEEAGLTIMAALDDVERNAIELDAGAARHEVMLAQNN